MYNEIGRRENEDTPCKERPLASYLESVIYGDKSGVSVKRGMGAGVGIGFV